jgi:hypothetical protein
METHICIVVQYTSGDTLFPFHITKPKEENAAEIIEPEYTLLAYFIFLLSFPFLLVMIGVFQLGNFAVFSTPFLYL